MSYLSDLDEWLDSFMQYMPPHVDGEALKKTFIGKVRESYYNGVKAGRKPAQSPGKPEGTSAGKTS